MSVGPSLRLQGADAATEAELSQSDSKPQGADTPSVGREDQDIQQTRISKENPETKEDESQDCAEQHEMEEIRLKVDQESKEDESQAKQHDIEDTVNSLNVEPREAAGSETGSWRHPATHLPSPSATQPLSHSTQRQEVETQEPETLRKEHQAPFSTAPDSQVQTQAQGLGLRVSGFGFRVSGLGLRV